LPTPIVGGRSRSGAGYGGRLGLALVGGGLGVLGGGERLKVEPRGWGSESQWTRSHALADCGRLVFEQGPERAVCVHGP
jgi:hypothetical protein